MRAITMYKVLAPGGPEKKKPTGVLTGVQFCMARTFNQLRESKGERTLTRQEERLMNMLEAEVERYEALEAFFQPKGEKGGE